MAMMVMTAKVNDAIKKLSENANWWYKTDERGAPLKFNPAIGENGGYEVVDLT